MKRFPIFFAPDTDTAAPAVDVGTGDISVPMVPPTPREVKDVVLPGNENLENAPILKDLAKETRKVRGPSDFGMPTAEESSEEMGLTPKRERGPDGKFLPKGTQQSSPSTQQPKAKATTPPAAQKPTPTAAPAKAPEPAATPAPAAKVKINGVEKTEAEWAEHFKALEAKANGAKAPEPVVKQPDAPAKTEEETAAEQKAREDAFLAKAAEGYAMTPEEYDIILAGGAQGVKAHANVMARQEMKLRQFAASEINKVTEHYDALLAPILNQQTTVQTLMQEAAFLSAHPDIKSNPKGLETFREVKNAFETGHKEIKAKVDAGTASRSEQAWAMLYEDASQEQRMNDIAEHTRAKLGPIAAPAAAATTPPKPPAPKPTIIEKPLGGDRPGSPGSPRSETAEQRLVREVNASKGINV